MQPGTAEDRPVDCSAEGDVSARADIDLVRSVRRGDKGAFGQLFHRYHKRIFNIAMHVLQNESDAADVTQEVFVRVYHSISTLKSDAAFVTWLKTMTINRCRDILRKRKREKLDSLDSGVENSDGDSFHIELPDWSSNPERRYDKKLMQETVRRAIGSLSPAYREVVVLFYVDGSDVAAITRMLNCPEGTVKSRLSRARSELKRKLEAYVKQ